MTSSIGDIASDVSQFAGLQVYQPIDRLYARPLIRLLVLGAFGLPANTIDAINEVANNLVISLDTLNLLLGQSVGLPRGIAQAKNLKRRGIFKLHVSSLGNFDLFKTINQCGAALSDGSIRDAPFWLYLLQERRSQNQGTRLGEFRVRIEAEVIFSMFKYAKVSILRRRRP